LIVVFSVAIDPVVFRSYFKIYYILLIYNNLAICLPNAIVAKVIVAKVIVASADIVCGAHTVVVVEACMVVTKMFILLTHGKVIPL
jgi:hypothetical protein